MDTDIMYNILLQADDNTISSLCKTNKQANKICNDKQFWIDKFALHHLEPLLIDYDSDALYPYVTWFHYAMKNVEDANNILKINYLEKNRKYDKTKGIFQILIMEEGIKILYYYFPSLMDNDFYYDKLIFTLLDNEYHLEITHDGTQKIDLGKFTLKQVEMMLPSLLEISEECTDNMNYQMIYDVNNVYEMTQIHNNIHSQHAKVLLIRRGMWEMIYANK